MYSICMTETQNQKTVLICEDCEGVTAYSQTKDAKAEAYDMYQTDESVWAGAIIYEIPTNLISPSYDEGSTHRTGVLADESLDIRDYIIDEWSGHITGPTPDCAEGKDHDWTAHKSIEGGLDDNPGVFGFHGGVIIKEHCRHCHSTITTNTWATNPHDGTQGHETVEYGELDERYHDIHAELHGAQPSEEADD